MRVRTWGLAVLAAGLLVGMGCAEEKQHMPMAETMAEAKPHPPRITARELAAQKASLAKLVNGRLAELPKQMAKLQSEADARGADAREWFDRAKADIDSKVAVAQAELAKATAARADKWKDANASTRAALKDVSRTYRKVVARIEGKPAATE